MLSFDITDRHIRVIRGSENNGKIKINTATTIEVEEGIIVNGHIKDIPKVATLINNELKAKKISDKEALVCMSSNLVIFKELHVPKAKGAQLYQMVKNQMQHTMGVNDEYAISYTIAGEVQEEDGVAALKVLTTACPTEILDSFRKVFAMLSIQLRSVSISCNCITRVVLADTKNKTKQPLLVVQIDANFISLNLYEGDQLSFSRFATIDKADYDNSDDYVFEAVTENVLRMLQFQRSRGAEEGIENVLFYGDTTEYVRLTDHFAKMDLKTGLVGVPGHISGYENIEFQHYANAIGAMYKRQKDVEKINLLELEQGGNMSSTGSFAATVVIVAAVCALIVGAVYFGFVIQNNMITDDINRIDQYLQSEDVVNQLAEVSATSNMITKVNEYTANAQIAYDAFLSKPVFTTEVLNNIERCLPTGVGIESISYGEGTVSFTVTVPEQVDPAEMVQKLDELDYFRSINYTGYSGNAADAAENGDEEENAFPLTLVIDNGEYNNREVTEEANVEGGDAE